MLTFHARAVEYAADLPASMAIRGILNNSKTNMNLRFIQVVKLINDENVILHV